MWQRPRTPPGICGRRGWGHHNKPPIGRPALCPRRLTVSNQQQAFCTRQPFGEGCPYQITARTLPILPVPSSAPPHPLHDIEPGRMPNVISAERRQQSGQSSPVKFSPSSPVGGTAVAPNAAGACVSRGQPTAPGVLYPGGGGDTGGSRVPGVGMPCSNSDQVLASARDGAAGGGCSGGGGSSGSGDVDVVDRADGDPARTSDGGVTTASGIEANEETVMDDAAGTCTPPCRFATSDGDGDLNGAVLHAMAWSTAAATLAIFGYYLPSCALIGYHASHLSKSVFVMLYRKACQ